jgi:Ca2+-binding EF-hand superfamily protein
MMRRNLLIACLSATAALAGTAFAQKAAVPKVQDKSALTKESVTDLLLQMDTNQDGKISKQEWMRFMEAEFDRLDRSKTGQLDRNELLQSKLAVKKTHFADAGK